MSKQPLNADTNLKEKTEVDMENLLSDSNS